MHVKVDDNLLLYCHERLGNAGIILGHLMLLLTEKSLYSPRIWFLDIVNSHGRSDPQLEPEQAVL